MNSGPDGLTPRSCNQPNSSGNPLSAARRNSASLVTCAGMATYGCAGRCWTCGSCCMWLLRFFDRPVRLRKGSKLIDEWTVVPLYRGQVSTRSELLGDELIQQPVEADRALGHRDVAAAVEDDEPGVAEVVLELECIGGRDHAVVPTPDDQGRDLDAVEPVEEVVAEERAEGGQEGGGVVGAVRELPQQLGSEPVRCVEDVAEHRVAQPPPPKPALAQLEAEPGGGRQQSRQRLGGAPAHVDRADPGGGEQHELLDPVRLGDRDLGRDEATHRVPDQGALLHLQLAAELVHEPPVVADRHFPRRHRAVAEARQVERDHAMVAGEIRDVLEPVLPTAGEPVNEHDRAAALAHLAVVHARPRDIHLTQMLAPIDPQPFRVRVAVRVGAVRRGRVGRWSCARERPQRPPRGVPLPLFVGARFGRALGANRHHAYPIRSRIGTSRICGGWRWSQRIPRGRWYWRSTSITARGVAIRSTGRSCSVDCRCSRRIWIGCTVVATVVWSSILPASISSPYSRSENPPPFPIRAPLRFTATEPQRTKSISGRSSSATTRPWRIAPLIVAASRTCLAESLRGSRSRNGCVARSRGTAMIRVLPSSRAIRRTCVCGESGLTLITRARFHRRWAARFFAEGLPPPELG